MNRRVLATLIVSLTATLSQPQAQVAPRWYSIGLASHVVHSLLCDDTNMVLAGTDEGLFVLWNDQWYQVPIGSGSAGSFAVRALARLSSGGIAVAADAASGADGLYTGDVAIYGPPFYVLSLVDTVSGPQSLALRGSRNDTIYVGAGNRVLRSLPNGLGGHGRLQPLRLPAYSFGVENPLCAGLHVCSADGRLYAGGFDLGAMGGPGHLVAGAADSLATVRTLNVSVITQGVFFEVGPVELVVGTMDSGVYTMQPGGTAAWSRFDSPAKQSVRHLIAVPGMMWSDILYAAVSSGVYSGTRGNWAEVGDIPVVPLVLGAAGYGIPYAGTQDGVYRYGEPPVAAQSPRVAARPAPRNSAGGRFDLLGRSPTSQTGRASQHIVHYIRD